MARGMPSLTALLGLIAVAGYQNRDKIGDFVKSLGSADSGRPRVSLPENTKKSVGEGEPGGNISGGLAELVERFRNNGQRVPADSWVADGPNTVISDSQVGQVLGSDLIDALVKQTGLSRHELLTRLANVLPEFVDKMTPSGRVIDSVS